mgnify:CR=1 FL=1
MTRAQSHNLYLKARAVLLAVGAAVLGTLGLANVPNPAHAQSGAAPIVSDTSRVAALPNLSPLPAATALPVPKLAQRLPRSAGFEREPADSTSSPSSPRAAWQLFVEGSRTAWPGDPPAAPSTRLDTVAHRVLHELQASGYYYAEVDSAVVTPSTRPPTVQLYVRRGPKVVVDQLRIAGNDAIPATELRRLVQAREGRPLAPEQLEADIEAMLQVYEDAGFPLAQIRIAETTLHPGDPLSLSLEVAVEEGPKLWLKKITVPESARTSPSLIAHLADLSLGEPLAGYDPTTIQQRLQSAGLFESVDAPALQVGDDGGATLHVPVEEGSPGAFDLVLGYLPGSRSGTGGGQLVGSGHLSLENLFGGGRTAELELDRRPGQGSLFDISVADPYVAGWPLRMEGRFRGEQRDSTFGQRRYEVGIGVRFDGGLELRGTASREVTRPGQAGARLQGERQRIPRAEALFYGVGVTFERVDDPRAPRRGGRLEVVIEQGRKERRFFRHTASGDTTRVRESVQQERITGTARWYVPVFDRQVVAAGMDAQVLLSPGYDRSDLFRLGGAQSLRGYDEDRFLGNAVGRVLLEYRVLIDRVSYAYAFGDVGFVERPALQDGAASRRLHPGYGIGIQFGTAIGIVNASYALNPDEASPADGRVHLGLSVAL